MRWLRHGGASPPHLVSIVYGWDYQGINPVRSPSFRSSASVRAQRSAFATGVLPDICAFHRYTRNSGLPCATQARRYRERAGVEPRALTPDQTGRLRALYAQ